MTAHNRDAHDTGEPGERARRNIDGRRPGKFLGFTLPAFRPGPAAATGAAFLLSVLVIMNSIHGGAGGSGETGDFEAGKVAERDVIAEQSISYIDEGATSLRREAQRRLVPAAFTYVPDITEKASQDFAAFAAFSRARFEEQASLEGYRRQVSAAFPGLFLDEDLEILFNAQDRSETLRMAGSLLEHFMEEGVFDLPQTGLEEFNPDTVEVLRSSGARTGRERVGFNRIVTLNTLSPAIDRYVDEGFPPSFRLIAYDLLKPFIRENVFFSALDSSRRLEEAGGAVEPVVKYIEQGKRVIRKGFIVTDDEMSQLNALNPPAVWDPRVIIGQILLFLLLYGFFVFLGNAKLIGRSLTSPEIYLLSALTALYMIGATLANNLSFNTEIFPVSIVLPTALVVMLPSLLIGPPLALAWALALPLGAFFAAAFDVSAYMFALVSGVAASYTLRRAEKRMDLVKAGLIIAGANGGAAIAILLINGAATWGDYLVILFWAAFNGVASGMLVLGILPPLEHALNAATAFRLIELSDLNAPLLKRLFTVASGTYSHSIMVANLAEAACQEIGANPLLARVGAYYHDIGKMEQPNYFVENQTSHNKHDDIPPSLSAAIIRSHVRIGVEKARSLGLPEEVTDIVAEHHGNSVITWFYSKALEQDPQADPEEFSYPGSPPRSRESAVVMLADVSEAAVRTLENPTPDRIDKFIQQLINAKVEHGQLAASELTFRDLETIKRAFVQVLAGYYHSRIKYPALPPKAPALEHTGDNKGAPV
ncbi:MAG: HDIG domain-containing protein [Spirochaetaceae bacterium]|jgi:putative nucleotidyltransferase with HDIG domain|nr:HDIG domain-containing protein [Spirochaetaceae bacterium]